MWILEGELGSKAILGVNHTLGLGASGVFPEDEGQSFLLDRVYSMGLHGSKTQGDDMTGRVREGRPSAGALSDAHSHGAPVVLEGEQPVTDVERLLLTVRVRVQDLALLPEHTEERLVMRLQPDAARRRGHCAMERITVVQRGLCRGDDQPETVHRAANRPAFSRASSMVPTM